jgi:hypothetical protein
MLQINGREIFQKERVDKGYRENRRRDSRGIRDAGCHRMEPSKLLQRRVTTGKQGKRGPQGLQVPSDSEVI